MDSPDDELDLSVIAPARDEGCNLADLVAETAAVLEATGLAWELIIVDDASTDGSARLLASLAERYPQLVAIGWRQAPAVGPRGRERTPGRTRARGQSAALAAGVRAARGRLVAFLDADLQNVPADLPAMIDCLDECGCDLVQGDRTRARRDSIARRVAAAFGRVTRRLLLDDRVRDTGCALRVMRREVATSLPLEFAGMHRFIPEAARQLGFRVEEMDVRHRPRLRGHTHYGILDRGFTGLIDCLAVRWMERRRRALDFDLVASAAREPVAS